MTTSLYQLHQIPQQLFGHNQRWKIPEEAAEMLKANPGNPQLEQRIAHDADLSFLYAKYVLEDRFKLGEPAIMQNPQRALKYAMTVLKNTRWLEAEPYIMKRPQSAMLYAKHVIKGSWPEAEPYIKTSRFFWKLYKDNLKVKS